MKKKLLLFSLLITAMCARAQDYTTGNLIVSYNTGTDNSGAFRNLILQEYTTGTTRTANSATAIGGAVSTGRMVDDRKVTYEGQINTSADGKYIVLTGRNTTDGTAAGTARLAPLSLVRVSKSKTIEYSDFLAADVAFNNRSGRSTASVDGSTFFVATANTGADAGIRLADFGSTSNTSYFAESSRSIGIWNNEVVAAGGNDPSRYISGVASDPGTVPTSPAPAFTGPGDPNNYSGLVLFDVDGTEAGNDLMYVSQRYTGMHKYYKNAGVWTYVSTANTADEHIGASSGFQAMTGRIENGKPVLYVIKMDNAANIKTTLYQVIDNTPRTGDWNAGGADNPTYTILATSDLATAQTFRGVTFAPTATTLATASFEKNAVNWAMYPNPSKGILNINSEVSGSFNIYNVLGQKVHQFKVDNGSNTINLDKLKSGTYFVEGANATQKLIIQK
jgi:hypothetical protein